MRDGMLLLSAGDPRIEETNSLLHDRLRDKQQFPFLLDL
jgi:hypothetical protein